MSLASQMQVTDQDIRSTSTTQGGEQFGQTAKTSDGRTFAYGLASTIAAPGKLQSGALSTANYVNRTGVTTTVGQNQVTFTLGTTATANAFAGGYLYVNAGTGAGQLLSIAGNTAATAGTSNATTVYLNDAIITATAVADSKFSIQPSPYSATVIAPQASATAIFPVGVPSVSIAAASYGWYQTGGPASVLANGTIAIAANVIPSATTDGAVDTDGAASVQVKVGYTLVASVSTEYRAVYLTVNS